MTDLIIDWDTIEARTVIPGFSGKAAHSTTMTFVNWEIAAGAVLPEHSHPHEQVIHVHSGALETTVGGVTSVLRAGMVGVVPPNVPHSGRALTDCRVLDVFNPIREDYRGGAPSVLQGAMERRE